MVNVALAEPRSTPARGMRYEWGVMAKHCPSIYRSGRSASWVKLKCPTWREGNCNRGDLFGKDRQDYSAANAAATVHKARELGQPGQPNGHASLEPCEYFGVLGEATSVC